MAEHDVVAQVEGEWPCSLRWVALRAGSIRRRGTAWTGVRMLTVPLLHRLLQWCASIKEIGSRASGGLFEQAVISSCSAPRGLAD